MKNKKRKTKLLSSNLQPAAHAHSTWYDPKKPIKKNLNKGFPAARFSRYYCRKPQEMIQKKFNQTKS